MSEQEKLDRMEQIEIDIAKLKKEYSSIYNNSLLGLKNYKNKAITNTFILAVAYFLFIFMMIIQDATRMFFIMFSIGISPFFLSVVISGWKTYYRMKNDIL